MSSPHVVGPLPTSIMARPAILSHTQAKPPNTCMMLGGYTYLGAWSALVVLVVVQRGEKLGVGLFHLCL